MYDDRGARTQTVRRVASQATVPLLDRGPGWQDVAAAELTRLEIAVLAVAHQLEEEVDTADLRAAVDYLKSARKALCEG